LPPMLDELKRIVQQRKDTKTIEYPHPMSPAQAQYEALSSRDEIRNRDKLNDRVKMAEDIISALNLSKNDLQRELTYSTFPKNMKFGFSSFVIFAILGVIFPLTYNIWGEYLLSDPNLISLLRYTDTMAIILFSIGLALTFVYIGLELRHALGLGSEFIHP
jgi:hypothetical protein